MRPGEDSREAMGEWVTDVFADDCREVFWLPAGTPVEGSVGAGWLLVVLLIPLAETPSGTVDDLSMRAVVKLGVRGATGDYTCQRGVC